MSSTSATATRRFLIAATCVVVGAASLSVDIVYLHTGSVSLQQKGFGFLVILLALYTKFSLYEDIIYHRKLIELGCGPVPVYPNNPLGLRFLLESAKALKAHAFLRMRLRQLDDANHTFQHSMFPNMNTMIQTDEPENVKAMLSTKFEDWNIPEQRVRGFLPVLGHHSIFTTNGPEWQHARAMLRPAFVRDQISDLKCFDRHIAKLIARIPRDGSRFDLQALLGMLTIDSISDFMFGQSTEILGKAQERDVKFGTLFDLSLIKIGRRARLSWMTMILPDSELNEYVRFLRNYVDDFVAQRREITKDQQVEKAQKYVFLDELLESREPDEVVRNQLLSIFLAGRDTTTSVLAYLFYELSRRPEIVVKIQQEIDECNSDPTWEELKSMKYLNWAVRESLRLNPPVPSNSRQAVRDTVLPSGGGTDGKSPILIPEGSLVTYHVWSMHRRKDLYGEDAEEFRPERWESIKPGFEYLPFNAGPRICIGQNFALTQLALVTFRLLQAFKTIERKDDNPATLKLAINTSFLHGCWVSMTPV